MPFDFLEPTPAVDLETGEGQDPRLRALQKLMEQEQSGRVIDPDDMRAMKRETPVLDEEYVPRSPYRIPQQVAPDAGSSAENYNPMANVPMLKRKPYEGLERTPQELQQLYDELDKKALSPEEQQEETKRKYFEPSDLIDYIPDGKGGFTQDTRRLDEYNAKMSRERDPWGERGTEFREDSGVSNELAEYLRTLPPRALDRWQAERDATGDTPSTDGEIDKAYGKGAVEREMSGHEPYDRGFYRPTEEERDMYPRRRRKNMPPSERFQEETFGSGEFIEDRRN